MELDKQQDELDESKETFRPIFERLISHEKGYVFDPEDLGGETIWGVTIRTARANDYMGEMHHMSREEAFDIYYSAFWLRYKCDTLNPAVAYQFFDICVNSGFGNASRMLQRSVDVVDDGIIGKITLKAIKRYSPEQLIMRLNAQRLFFYVKCSTWKRFGKGWINRTGDNIIYGADDCLSINSSFKKR